MDGSPKVTLNLLRAGWVSLLCNTQFFGTMAGIYHASTVRWFPKMFGRMMNAGWGYFHFWFTFIGVYLVFFSMHYLGIAGFPRRYYAFTSYDFTHSFGEMNQFISLAAFVTFGAQFMFLINFFWSMFKGTPAPQNPWKSNALEWTTPIVPPHGNWPGDLPIVYRWPYDYSKPGATDDFIPQTVPFSATPESNLSYEQLQTPIGPSPERLNGQPSGIAHNEL